MEAVIALFRGPAHVLVDGNDADRAIVPAWAWGMPVREAFPDAFWHPVQKLMDEVFADGRPRSIFFEGGLLTVAPLRDSQDHLLGVGTHYVALARRSPRLPRRTAGPLPADAVAVPPGTRTP